MSTKLDHLVALVDNLDSRSARLLNSIQESNYLIADIMNLNNSISNADMSINEMSDRVSSNYAFLNEFENLYEKSFLLESNMHLNDVVTSKTTLDNLYQEYQFLANRFTGNKDQVCDYESPVKVSEESMQPTHIQTPPRLHNAISVSNLKLKPMRIRSKKIPRKKSSIRVLSTSTVKQVDRNDNMLLSIADEYVITSHGSSLGKRSSNHDMFTTPLPKKIAITHNDTTDSSMQTSNYMDVWKSESNDDSNTISTSPDLFSELHSRIKVRSSSLPQTPKIDKFELNSFNIFKSPTSKFNSSNASHQLNDYNNINETNNDLLRVNRLKHFVSFGSGYPLHVDEDYSSSQQSQPHDNESIFNKTPTFTPVDFESNEIDEASSCSEFSGYSSEGLKDDIENFEKYLRKSRVNLAESFPNIITKSRSHDSIFTKDSKISLPESAPTKNFKFHNPIDNMNLNCMKTATTTVEPIYYQGNDKISGSSIDVNKLKGNTTKYLNDVISKTDKNNSSKNRTPNKIKQSLFNYLNSPSKTPDPYSPSKLNPRRGSLDLVRLSDSFMSLVNSTALDKFKNHDPSGPSHRNKRPSRRAGVAMNAKDRPIATRNDALIKRLPPRRKDGAHSNLIIGPNKTKILNHGDQSVFKKPLMTKISRNSLSEALSQSIL